jgi:cell division protein FtsB
MTPAARVREPSPSFLRRRYRETSRRRAQRLLFLLGGALLLYALILGDNGLLRTIQTRREVDRLEADLTWLRAHHEQLFRQIEDLERPGGFTLEKVAREQYGLSRSGERVIHVIEPGASVAAPPMPPAPQRGESRHREPAEAP